MKLNLLPKLALILFIISMVSLSIASAIFHGTGADNAIGDGNFPPGKAGERFTVDDKQAVPLGQQTTKVAINLTDEDVIIREGAGAKVETWYHGMVNAKTWNRAPKLILTQNGDSLTIRVERSRHGIMAWTSAKLQLEVSIPKTYAGSLTVATASGEIQLGDHSYSRLEAGSQSGNITLHHMHTDETNVSTASGDIAVESGTLGEAHVSSVSGDVRLEGITTKQLEVSSISGDIKANGLQSDSIGLSSVSGSASFDRISGKTKAQSTSGDITLSYVTTPGWLEASVISGDILIHLPADAAFKLEADSTAGDVTCDFPITTTVSTTHRSNQKLSGTVGSGTNPISLNSTSGDISIERR